MYNDRFLEHPDITESRRTGYPWGYKPSYPHCPFCGDECSWIYKDDLNVVLGCDNCYEYDEDEDADEEITKYDAWEADECFP